MKTVSMGVSKLKSMRIKDFKELDSVLLIEEFENKPISAVIPYGYYLQMQSRIMEFERATELRREIRNA